MAETKGMSKHSLQKMPLFTMALLCFWPFASFLNSNQDFCYFTNLVDDQAFPKKIYYYGKLVGEESTGFMGFQFNRRHI